MLAVRESPLGASRGGGLTWWGLDVVGSEGPYCAPLDAADTRQGDLCPMNEASNQLIHGYWFVAYLDLLGIREKFLQTDFLPGQDAAKRAALVQALRQSVGSVRRLRRMVEDYFASSSARWAELLANDPAAKPLASARVRRDPVSDGIMFACPLMPADGHYPIHGVWSGLSACLSLFLYQLAEGQPLRGGIDVATALESEDELFGAAVAKAYVLESEHAKYPRLAVGDGLISYLQASADPESPADPFERAFASDMLNRFFAKDLDGQTIVDYAGAGVRDAIPPTTHLLVPAKAFAVQERERFRISGNEKLLQRYTQLVAYLDSRGVGD